MKKKEILVILTVLIIAPVIGGGVVWKGKISSIPAVILTPSPYKTYPSILIFNFYSIHEIKQQRLGPGSYNTEGYVVKIFTCPPCPTGALCKPCMGESIVISEESKILTDYSSLSDKELIIFVKNPGQFQLGKKYQFSIKIVKDKRMTFEPTNDVRLIGYQEAIEESCDELKKRITTLLNQANYCQKDSDCEIAANIPAGCPFSCYNLVNKNEDLLTIERLISKFQGSCEPHCPVQLQCAAPPKPEEIICQNNKCLDIRFKTEQ